MIRRAITEGWDVPVEDRPDIIAELVSVVRNSDQERDKIGAAKALMAATGLQLTEAKLRLERKKLKQSQPTEGSKTGHALNQFLYAPESGQEGG